ncbi:Phosphatidylinositol-4-phosphate-5-kinase, partial [Globisporangium splendens]
MQCGNRQNQGEWRAALRDHLGVGSLSSDNAELFILQFSDSNELEHDKEGTQRRTWDWKLLRQDEDDPRFLRMVQPTAYSRDPCADGTRRAYGAPVADSQLEPFVILNSNEVADEATVVNATPSNEKHRRRRRYRRLEASSPDIERLEAHFEEPLERNFDVLMTQPFVSGAAKSIPWSSDYWPMYRDGINYVWHDNGEPSPSEKYAKAFGQSVQELQDTLLNNNGILGQQSESSSSCSQHADCPKRSKCGIRDGEQSGVCILEWYGICHAWMAAATMKPEPKCDVERNGVLFRPRDIKALISQVYDGAEVGTLFTGARFDGPDEPVRTDAYGRYEDPFERDLVVHRRCRDRLGGLESTGSRLRSRHDGVARYRSSVPPMAWRIHIVESELDGDLGSSNRIEEFTEAREYAYFLELDSPKDVIGGEWLEDLRLDHPDFLWLTLGKPNPGAVTSRLKSISTSLREPHQSSNNMETITVLAESCGNTSTNNRSQLEFCGWKRPLTSQSILFTTAHDRLSFIPVGRIFPCPRQLLLDSVPHLQERAKRSKNKACAILRSLFHVSWKTTRNEFTPHAASVGLPWYFASDFDAPMEITIEPSHSDSDEEGGPHDASADDRMDQEILDTEPSPSLLSVSIGMPQIAVPFDDSDEEQQDEELEQDAHDSGCDALRPPSFTQRNHGANSDALEFASMNENGNGALPDPRHPPSSGEPDRVRMFSADMAIWNIVQLLKLSSMMDKQIYMSLTALVLLFVLGACALVFRDAIFNATHVNAGLILGSAETLAMRSIIIGTYLTTKWYRRHMHILLVNLATFDLLLALSFVLEPAWKHVGAGVGDGLTLGAIITSAFDAFDAPVAVGNFCWVGAKHDTQNQQQSNTSRVFGSNGIWIFIVTPVTLSMAANMYVTFVSYNRFRDGISESLKNRHVLLREGFLTTVTVIVYSALLWGVYGSYWVSTTTTQMAVLSHLFAFLLSYRGIVAFILWCLYKRPRGASLRSKLRRKQKHKQKNHMRATTTSTKSHASTDLAAVDDYSDEENDEAVRPQMNIALLQELVHCTTEGIAMAARQVRDSTDADTTSCTFTLRPSTSSSPLSWNDCRFTDFYPQSFLHICSFFGIQEDAFLASLATCVTPKVSEGASGSFMFYSSDRSYIAKSLTSHEKAKRGSETTCRRCNLTFRCGVGRNVCPNRADSHEPNVVLKDMDLTTKLRFGKVEGRKLVQQLKTDNDFLCGRGIMDYSLLLSAIEVSYQVNQHNILTRDGSVFLGSILAAQVGEEDEDADEDQDKSPMRRRDHAKKQSAQCLRTSEVVIGPGFYYIGLIDILQTWSFAKRMERFIKTVILRKDPDGISAMAPKPYRDRFHRKLDEIIHLGHNATAIPASPRSHLSGGAIVELLQGQVQRGSIFD